MSPVAQKLLVVFLVLFCMLNMAALMIWIERRLLALYQDRIGPNRAGPFGLLIIAADMIKIFTKEDWIPPFADKVLFVIAPAIILATTLLSFAVVPFAPGISVLDPEALNGTNRMKLFVFANEEIGQARLVALLDNLGKGASGAAVQNLNLMLGLDEAAGL